MPAAGIVAEAMVALVLADAVAGEVRRRQRARDPPQCAQLPRQPGDQMTSPLVVLVGPPGAGKSTVGALLAERLGVGYRDTDADIVATAGRPIAEIFIDEGEPHFRDLERAAVRDALDEPPGRALARRRRDPGRRHPQAAGRPAGGLPGRPTRRCRQAGGPRRAPPAAGRQPAEAVARADGAPPPAVHRGRARRDQHGGAHPRRRSPRRSWTLWSYGRPRGRRPPAAHREEQA